MAHVCRSEGLVVQQLLFSQSMETPLDEGKRKALRPESGARAPFLSGTTAGVVRPDGGATSYRLLVDGRPRLILARYPPGSLSARRPQARARKDPGHRRAPEPRLSCERPSESGGPSLAVPPSGHQVAEEDDGASIFKNQSEVLPGDGIAPPLVVDPPVFPHCDHPKPLSTSVQLGGQTVGTRPDLNRSRGPQRAKPLAVKFGGVPVVGAVGWRVREAHRASGFVVHVNRI